MEEDVATGNIHSCLTARFWNNHYRHNGRSEAKDTLITTPKMLLNMNENKPFLHKLPKRAAL